MRAVTLAKDWVRPCFGRAKPEKGGFDPIDPNHRFVTNGDRRARCIWLTASAAAVVTFVAVWTANPQFGEDGRYYLLSSISQILAAVIALAATLPLLFAGLSDYLPFCANRLVASRHYRWFVAVFIGSIILALVVLCFKCAPPILTVVSLATAAGCLCSLLPYLLWIADRTRPKNHFDDLQSIADAIARTHEKVTDRSLLAEAAADVLEYLELLTQAASAATLRGGSNYLGQALISVMVFWLKYDARGTEWAANRGALAWRNFLAANDASFLAVDTAAECAARIFVKECWTGTLKPSAEVFGLVADSLPTKRPTQDSSNLVAIRGQWRLGAVAQHVEADGERPRAVARCVAVAIGDIPEVNLQPVCARFEDRVRQWFQGMYQINPSPELTGFHALVIEEHHALRRRLDEASR